MTCCEFNILWFFFKKSGTNKNCKINTAGHFLTTFSDHIVEQFNAQTDKSVSKTIMTICGWILHC